ncbi:vomeronasal type-2 receptor 116-like, partial [Sigmodon hispidus]
LLQEHLNKYALALAFSVDEVNRRPDILPNMSLEVSYLPFNCKSMSTLYEDFELTKATRIPANYNYDNNTICLVMLLGPSRSQSLIFGKAMEFYYSDQVVQITFGPFHPILSDQEQFPYMYQMAPKDISLALAMISLIIHFRWNWIGLTISDNDHGTQFLSYLRREMEKNTVCFAFINIIPVDKNLYMSRAESYYNQIMTSSTNVVIIFGDTDSTLALCFRNWESLGIQKIWIANSEWDFTASNSDFSLDSSHRILTFAYHHAEISGLKSFLQILRTSITNDFLARLQWMNFNCAVSPSKCKTLKNCLLNVSLEWLMVQTFDIIFSDGSYNIYDAAYMTAHFFQEMFIQSDNNGIESQSNCFKMNSFLKRSYFKYHSGNRLNISQEEKLLTEYDIFQIWIFPNGLGLKVKIGIFTPYFPRGQQIHLYEDIIEWATGSKQDSFLCFTKNFKPFEWRYLLITNYLLVCYNFIEDENNSNHKILNIQTKVFTYHYSLKYSGGRRNSARIFFKFKEILSGPEFDYFLTSTPFSTSFIMLHMMLRWFIYLSIGELSPLEISMLLVCLPYRFFLQSLAFCWIASAEKSPMMKCATVSFSHSSVLNQINFQEVYQAVFNCLWDLKFLSNSYYEGLFQHFIFSSISLSITAGFSSLYPSSCSSISDSHCSPNKTISLQDVRCKSEGRHIDFLCLFSFSGFFCGGFSDCLFVKRVEGSSFQIGSLSILLVFSYHLSVYEASLSINKMSVNGLLPVEIYTHLSNSPESTSVAFVSKCRSACGWEILFKSKRC